MAIHWLCERGTPFGAPSVPDVQQIVNTSSAEMAATAATSVSIRGRRRPGGQPLRAVDRAAAREQQRCTTSLRQSRPEARVVEALEFRDGDDGLRLEQRHDLVEFVPPVLHRDRAEHDPGAGRRKVERNTLPGVRQLRQHHVAVAQPEAEQLRGDRHHGRIQLRIAEPPRLAEAKCRAVRRIDDRRPRRVRRNSAGEQVAHGDVRPPAEAVHT